MLYFRGLQGNAGLMDVPFAAGYDLIDEINGHIREGLQVFADVAFFAGQGNGDADHTRSRGLK